MRSVLVALTILQIQKTTLLNSMNQSCPLSQALQLWGEGEQQTYRDEAASQSERRSAAFWPMAGGWSLWGGDKGVTQSVG